MHVIPFLVSFLVVMCSTLHAASVSLTWQANGEPDLAGYRIYQRILSSTDYGLPIFFGLPKNPALPQHTITNLLEHTSYAFIVTTVDSAGNERSPSNEERIVISGSDSTSPEISSPSTNATSTSDGTEAAINNFPPSVAAPAPGTTLTSPSVTFTGGHASIDAQQWVYVGSTPGANNYYSGGVNGNHQFTVSGLPSSGMIYVRYSSRTSSTSAWQHQIHDYIMHGTNGQ